MTFLVSAVTMVFASSADDKINDSKKVLRREVHFFCPSNDRLPLLPIWKFIVESTPVSIYLSHVFAI